MSTINIRGVPVDFPFEPYDLQKNYMEKVIECLQEETNGVLESPTGTGKTLSLLCSSLGWLQVKKAQIQAQRMTSVVNNEVNGFMGSLLKELTGKVDANIGDTSGRAFMGLPTIIYASRTHTQLSQAMGELKRSAYKHMKACVLGSREQMCIHPEVIIENTNSARTQMCRLKVKSHSCHFHNRVERKKEDPVIKDQTVVDIEDLVKLGDLHKFCPYYMAREIQKEADIIFMPYNYLLDPKLRKSLGVVLSNNVVILDEAHNIERICEEAASIQIKSTDVALAIEEVTAVMKLLSEDSTLSFDEGPKDFTADELCILKQIMLDFEAALDAVTMENEREGASYPGTFIYCLFEKANINHENNMQIVQLIDKICNFLAISSGNGPFQRRGVGLELFSDLLVCTFQSNSKEFMEKIEKCFKVHILVEQPFNKKKQADNWLSKATSSKPACRVLNYWCFSPGFGMNMLMNQGIRCVILTSGTLAPLKPLISELELKVKVRLENPHIVKGDQICVKIVPKGPDGVILNGNFQNRENPQYINSLGCTILNITRHIPDGLLIFFSSYPIMQKYQDFWQQNGTWGSICQLKQIYVEPKDKEQFNYAMTEFYKKINDPNLKGAIFMGVCRGKVSEGLDFADANGRAVIVTGLPYPPLKDPRIILKKRYLDRCNQQDKEYLKGDDWYSLEATRAVNQAIGRVIRHRHDFGAILLLDQRFDNFRVKNNLSLWLRNHIKTAANFGEIVRDLRQFFKNAGETLPAPKQRTVNTLPAEFDTTGKRYKNTNGFQNFQFDGDIAGGSNSFSENGLVTIHKRPNANDLINPAKKKKIVLKKNTPITQQDSRNETKEFIALVKRKLDMESYTTLVQAMGMYRNEKNLENLTKDMDKIFLKKRSEVYLLDGLKKYIRKDHVEQFEKYVKSLS